MHYAKEGDPTPQPYALACGALDGFGGFLSEDLRHHDYMLGRRNCQRFLLRHFVLPADKKKLNSVMAEWTDPATRAPFEVKRPIKVGNRDREIVHLPVIPLLGKLGSPDYTRVPDWPAQPSDLRTGALRAAIMKRVNTLKERLVEQHQPSWLFRQGINFFWWRKRAQWIERFAIKPMVDGLNRQGIQPLD